MKKLALKKKKKFFLVTIFYFFLAKCLPGFWLYKRRYGKIVYSPFGADAPGFLDAVLQAYFTCDISDLRGKIFKASVAPKGNA